MKVHDIDVLISQYGDLKLSEIRLKIMGDRKYRCPNCNGIGVVRVKYNAYPSGLPDSGWVEDWKYKAVGCDLCNGHGYTVKEYVPNMIQQGWTTK